MMKFLLSLLLLTSTLAYGQAPTENATIVIDRTIQYIKKISKCCVDWTNNPTQVTSRKLLTDDLAQFDKVEHDITLVLIAIESDQKKEINGKEIVSQLTKLTTLASEILLNFKNDQALDDTVTVLLCQDLAETEIAPLAKELTSKLSNIK